MSTVNSDTTVVAPEIHVVNIPTMLFERRWGACNDMIKITTDTTRPPKAQKKYLFAKETMTALQQGCDLTSMRQDKWYLAR